MTEKLQETIKDEVVKLPKENQEAIGGLDWAKIAEEIGVKYDLDENQINNLQVETLLVLTGITDIQFFAINVENQVETIKDDAEKIAEEVSQKIFTPINNTLLEKIKKSDKVKNANAEQNLDFILSGGDYSVFLDVPPPLSGEDRGEVLNTPHPNPLLKVEGENTETVVPEFSITEENLKKSSV